jgi:hypothetical protein
LCVISTIVPINFLVKSGESTFIVATLQIKHVTILLLTVRDLGGTRALMYSNLEARPLINLTDITDIKAVVLCMFIEYSESLTHGAESFLRSRQLCRYSRTLQHFVEPKVSVHKSPPLVPIMSQINLIDTIPSYLRSILILSTHLGLGLPSCLFPSDFPSNNLYAFLFYPIRTTFLPISSSLTEYSE